MKSEWSAWKPCVYLASKRREKKIKSLSILALLLLLFFLPEQPTEMMGLRSYLNSPKSYWYMRRSRIFTPHYVLHTHNGELPFERCLFQNRPDARAQLSCKTSCVYRHGIYTCMDIDQYIWERCAIWRLISGQPAKINQIYCLGLVHLSKGDFHIIFKSSRFNKDVVPLSRSHLSFLKCRWHTYASIVISRACTFDLHAPYENCNTWISLPPPEVSRCQLPNGLCFVHNWASTWCAMVSTALCGWATATTTVVGEICSHQSKENEEKN